MAKLLHIDMEPHMGCHQVSEDFPRPENIPRACFLNGLSNPIIHLIPKTKNQGPKPWFLFLAKV